MAKPKAGKAGTYGKKNPKKQKGKLPTKTRKSSFKSKKTAKPVQKSLVSKELMEAIKEQRKEKQEKRIDKTGKKGENKKRKQKDLTENKPKEVLKKKDLKKLRKTNDNEDYEIIVKIKQLWEKARKGDISDAKRIEYIKELKALMKGRMESLMFKHDLARVFQMILKHGGAEHNSFIIDELKPYVQELSKSKYGKFIVTGMLTHSTRDQRNGLFRVLSGNFKKLALHADAVTVVDTFYNDYATSKQRTEMITEFYGRDLYLLGNGSSEHLSKILEQYPERKESILLELQKFSQSFIEKGLTGYIITQHLILQYVLHTTPENIHDLINEKLIEQLANIVHTKEGSKIAMRCLWYGSTKHRKNIIKTFKGHVVATASNENGYLALLAMFDCVDDTVLLKKVILTELLKDVDLVVMTKTGRNVLNYLLEPRGKWCHPLVVEMLKIGDSNPFSKKSFDVRHKELLDYSSQRIVDSFSGNMEGLFLDNATGLLLRTAVVNASCDITPLLSSLADICVSDVAFVEGLTAHIVLKSILQNPKAQKQFSEMLIERLDYNIITQWVKCNRGAFTILRMLEHKKSDNHKDLLESLSTIEFSSVPVSVGRDKLSEFLSAIR